jgi:predicted membrane channel-forming protein YqfA (hemolysin III family)
MYFIDILGGINMHVFVDGLLALERSNTPRRVPGLAQLIGGGGETLIAIVLAMILIAALSALILLYRVPGIGKSGKNKFLAYTSFTAFITILGISGIVFSSKIPFIGEFAGMTGLVAVVIALLLGGLIYVTYRNEMDFAKEVELEGKELRQKGDEIETNVEGMLGKASQRTAEAEKRKKQADELLRKYKRGEEE